MKKKIFFLLLMAFATTACHINAQVTTPFNNGGVGDYVGWNAAQAFPLNISHLGNQFVQVNQNGLLRMRFQNTNWTGLNSQTTNNALRTYMLADGYGTNTNPVSVLHIGQLNNNNASRNPLGHFCKVPA